MLKKAIAVLVLGLILVIYLLIPVFLDVQQEPRMSAWDKHYDDTSNIREQAETMNEMTRKSGLGIDEPKYGLKDSYMVRSIVTGPTILNLQDIDPEKTVYLVTGLERAYTREGIDGLISFLKRGGHVIIADNSENAQTLAAEFGVTIYPGKFFDESYDRNSSYTQINCHLGVDRLQPKYIPNDVEASKIMNSDDNPWPDGIWDDDTDGDGRVDEDPLESKYAALADDDKDQGKIINDGRDNDNDWVTDDGGVDENDMKIEVVGFEEGVNEDIVDDDGDGLEDEESLNGLDDDGDLRIDEDIDGYRVLLSEPSGMSSIGSRILAQGSVNSYVDMNGDGKITTPKPGDPKDQLIDAISSPGSEIQLIVEVVISSDNGKPVDLINFKETISGDEKTRTVSTLDLAGESDVEKFTYDMTDIDEFGSIMFIADSSMFINDLIMLDHITYAEPHDGIDNDNDGTIDELYEIKADEYDAEADGNYILDNTPDGIPDYDNARFFQELLYYYLPHGGVVIFDESRHAQSSKFLIPIYSTINTVVFLTSDNIYAISLVLITVFILILTVIITRSKESWVHKFDTSKFKGRKGMPESKRDKLKILRRSVLEKIRLNRGLSPDEFSQLSPNIVDSFIRDSQLIELVRNENKDYSDQELVNLSQKILAYR